MVIIGDACGRRPYPTVNAGAHRARVARRVTALQCSLARCSPRAHKRLWKPASNGQCKAACNGRGQRVGYLP